MSKFFEPFKTMGGIYSNDQPSRDFNWSYGWYYVSEDYINYYFLLNLPTLISHCLFEHRRPPLTIIKRLRQTLVTAKNIQSHVTSPIE